MNKAENDLPQDESNPPRATQQLELFFVNKRCSENPPFDSADHHLMNSKMLRGSGKWQTRR